jgi:hypothetical protein
VTVCEQAVALLADDSEEGGESVTTSTHIIIFGLCGTAFGHHFAVSVQAGPRLQDLVEGVTAEDNYYICDGITNHGKFVGRNQKQWLQGSKLWLVHTIGTVL